MGKIIFKQIFFFGIVGIFSTIINYSFYMLFLIVLNIHYIISAGLGFILGVFSGYLANYQLTFKSNLVHKKTIPIYLLVYLFDMVLNLLFLHILVGFYGFDPVISNIALAPFIIALNFFGIKFIAFRNFKW